MKELLLQYAEYNVWANKRMVDLFVTLDESLANQEIVSSFSSIRTTVHHVMAAEHIWLQRLQLVPQPVWVGHDFVGTFAEACQFWTNASDSLLAFVDACDDAALTNMMHYKLRNGTVQNTSVFQILHHVFNHSTYHRGQLVTMLRQVGSKEIPGTDFIGFVGKKQSVS